MGLISGKSDFQDWCEMHNTPDEIINKYNIYCGDNIVPLKIESKKDLVAYYPYLTTLIVFDKETGGKVYLSHDSFIDREERERLQWKLDEIKKYRRKCRRKKVPFNKDEAIKLISPFYNTDAPYLLEIVDRVMKNGDKATIDGIHDPFHERMREKWFDIMVSNGWDEKTAYIWVYGFKRWMDIFEREENDDNNSQS